MPSRVASLPAVAPIIPILRPDAFDDPEWLFEPKFDGFRGMLYLHGSRATFTSKQRRELARFSRLAAEVRDILKVRNAILQPRRCARVIGMARGRRMEPGIPRDWTPVLDVHPSALRPDCLTGYAWLLFPDRIREVHRQFLEFWYDPPGCALTDEELDLLCWIAAADEPVMFQAEGRTTRAEHAFDHRVDVLRDLRKAGWIVLEVRPAEKGDRGHAHRRYSAAQASCTTFGREALELIDGQQP